MPVVLQDNTANVKYEMSTGVSLAIRMMLEDTYLEANPKTPQKFGDLRARVIRNVQGNKGTISWESSYAGVQEQGFRRGANGIIMFRNYTTPGTGAHYAENAIEKVADSFPAYLSKVGLI